MRDSGKLEDRSPAKPEMWDKGQPKACIRGDAHGGVTKRGDSRSDKTSIAEASILEATQGSIAGTAKERKMRGDSQIRRRPGSTT